MISSRSRRKPKMGSVASKSSSRRKHKGGPLPPPLPPKPLDPRLKLDPKEKFHLQKSWKTVARNEDIAAMTMFISLFRSSPEIKEKWPQLRKLSEDEMRGSPYLQKLSVRILGAMDHVIDSLDDPDYLIPALEKLGQMHADMTNPVILPEDLWKLEGPFLIAVGEVLEDRFTRKYRDIYQKFIIFVLESIVIGFDPH